MATIQVFPETLVPTSEGSVLVPSMGTIETHDEEFAQFLVDTGHAKFVEAPLPEESAMSKSKKHNNTKEK